MMVNLYMGKILRIIQIEYILIMKKTKNIILMDLNGIIQYINRKNMLV